MDSSGEWGAFICSSDSSSRNVRGSGEYVSARGLSLRGPQIHLWLQVPCAFCLFLVSTPCFLANGLLLFISPRRQGHTVLDETQGSLLKETSPAPPPPRPWQAQKKNHFRISEHGFTNFLQKQAWENSATK